MNVKVGQIKSRMIQGLGTLGFWSSSLELELPNPNVPKPRIILDLIYQTFTV